MGWSLSLDGVDANGDPIQVDSHEEGSTYAIGGTTEPDIDITYNYGGQFASAWPEPLDTDKSSLVSMLCGKTAGDTIASLRTAVERLGTERSGDYWEPTAGNAGYILSILLRWAEQHPTAKWRVS